MSEQTPDTAYTVAEVAKRFNVTDQTIRDWIARGTLRAARPGGKTWIILESSIQTMLDAGDAGFAAERAGHQLFRGTVQRLEDSNGSQERPAPDLLGSEEDDVTLTGAGE